MTMLLKTLADVKARFSELTDDEQFAIAQHEEMHRSARATFLRNRWNVAADFVIALAEINQNPELNDYNKFTAEEVYDLIGKKG